MKSRKARTPAPNLHMEQGWAPGFSYAKEVDYENSIRSFFRLYQRRDHIK